MRGDMPPYVTGVHLELETLVIDYQTAHVHYHLGAFAECASLHFWETVNL